MTEPQARTLGAIIMKARTAKGLSTRELAEKAAVAKGWLAGIEAGRFLEPGPDRLARLAEVLDIEPSKMDRITRGAMTEGLPDTRTYFRAKYALNPEQIDKIERYIERLRRAA